MVTAWSNAVQSASAVTPVLVTLVRSAVWPGLAVCSGLWSGLWSGLPVQSASLLITVCSLVCRVGCGHASTAMNKSMVWSMVWSIVQSRPHAVASAVHSAGCSECEVRGCTGVTADADTRVVTRCSAARAVRSVRSSLWSRSKCSAVHLVTGHARLRSPPVRAFWSASAVCQCSLHGLVYDYRSASAVHGHGLQLVCRIRSPWHGLLVWSGTDAGMQLCR
jgi:hypothetical protein